MKMFSGSLVRCIKLALQTILPTHWHILFNKLDFIQNKMLGLLFHKNSHRCSSVIISITWFIVWLWTICMRLNINSTKTNLVGK